jgi:hypothetical protein
MSERRVLGGRPDKAALARMKVTTVIVSIATFVGSLGMISYLHPAAGAASNTGVQTVASTNLAQSTTSTTRSSRRALQLQGATQSGTVAPLTRTRGS